MNELIIESESGEHITTIQFSDEEWNSIIQVAMKLYVTKALKEYVGMLNYDRWLEAPYEKQGSYEELYERALEEGYVKEGEEFDVQAYADDLVAEAEDRYADEMLQMKKEEPEMYEGRYGRRA